MMEMIILVLCFICIILLTVLIFLLARPRNESLRRDLNDANSRLREDILRSQAQTRNEVSGSIHTSVSSLGQLLNRNQQAFAEQQEYRLRSFEEGSEQRLEAIRETMERRISSMTAENNERLDQMRQIVDEKLQSTLETKMNESFRLVSERLEQVYKGLGEMQTLASGVGDLKKVLSNVKTRGILGEIQLGAILSEILSPDQYETNVATRPGSDERVEFAVRLPADDGDPVLLPIDSKFPGDSYSALLDAYDSASVDEIKAASARLAAMIRKEAKDIQAKYIDPPNTTDFAIMFLPFEGLYAEVLKLNLVGELQQTYHVNVAGPSTMAALLNSLQMGFRTVAIQKRSSEVWQVLGAVKTEFEKFDSVLQETQKKLSLVERDLDQLVGVRTRSIVRKLRKVERLDDLSSSAVLTSERGLSERYEADDQDE